MVAPTLYYGYKYNHPARKTKGIICNQKLVEFHLLTYGNWTILHWEEEKLIFQRHVIASFWIFCITNLLQPRTCHLLLWQCIGVLLLSFIRQNVCVFLDRCPPGCYRQNVSESLGAAKSLDNCRKKQREANSEEPIHAETERKSKTKQGRNLSVVLLVIDKLFLRLQFYVFCLQVPTPL